MIQKAKIDLLSQHPFFAGSAMKMTYQEDRTVGTMAVNAKRVIKYNPDFVQTISRTELMAVIAHEVMHHILLHHVRGKGKDPDTWNKACDYVVNAILIKSGFKLPAGILYDPKYKDMNAEQVYNLIYKPGDDDDQQQSSQSSGEGDDKQESTPKPQDWGKVEIPDESENTAEVEAEAKQDAAEAVAIGKMAGNLPGGMEEVIAKVIEPKKDWNELLLKFLAEKARNDYSWTRPNQRYMASGIYLPSLESIELGKVAFVIDTSISVDENLLAEFVAEIKEASTMFNFPVTVIHCDTKVRKVEELEEDSEIVPAGRGGTAFRPAFDYVNENLPDTKALVYFTDGYCSDKLEEPDYDVLWIIYGNPHFKPEFGTVIHT